MDCAYILLDASDLTRDASRLRLMRLL